MTFLEAFAGVIIVSFGAVWLFMGGFLIPVFFHETLHMSYWCGLAVWFLPMAAIFAWGVSRPEGKEKR